MNENMNITWLNVLGIIEEAIENNDVDQFEEFSENKLAEILMKYM